MDTTVEGSQPTEDRAEEDEGIGDEANDGTTSLSSSIISCEHYCGRSYHRYFPECHYPFPNDERQLETEILADCLWRISLISIKGLHHLLDKVRDNEVLDVLNLECPFVYADLRESPQEVLDLGTGSGEWAIKFADSCPSACVTGVDLSPIQPTMVPPNCQFELNNLREEWLFPQKFDLIHGRHICAFVDPLHIVRSAYNALKPRGILEMQEIRSFRCLDNSWVGTHLKQWVDLICRGLNQGQMAEHSQLMIESGFENVECKKLAWPTNIWARGRVNKLLGLGFNMFLNLDLEGLSMWILTKDLGWSEEEVTVLCANVRKDLNNHRIHAYAEVSVTYGSKPWK